MIDAVVEAFFCIETGIVRADGGDYREISGTFEVKVSSDQHMALEPLFVERRIERVAVGIAIGIGMIVEITQPCAVAVDQRGAAGIIADGRGVIILTFKQNVKGDFVRLVRR